jgi:hypothetical protein
MVKADQWWTGRLHPALLPVIHVCLDVESFGSAGMGALPSNSILITLPVVRNGHSVAVPMTRVIASCDVTRVSILSD